MSSCHINAIVPLHRALPSIGKKPMYLHIFKNIFSNKKLYLPVFQILYCFMNVHLPLSSS